MFDMTKIFIFLNGKYNHIGNAGSRECQGTPLQHSTQLNRTVLN